MHVSAEIFSTITNRLQNSNCLGCFSPNSLRMLELLYTHVISLSFRTVGYGDLIPTSWLGRAITCVVMLSGIVVLALPIGIIGGNFAELYDEYKYNKKMAGKLHLETMDIQTMTDLFNLIDADGSDSVDIFELRAAFENHGLTMDGSKMLHFFGLADRAGGGKLSLSEFIHMCKLMQVHIHD